MAEKAGGVEPAKPAIVVGVHADAPPVGLVEV
jgi:hypothetical protein